MFIPYQADAPGRYQPWGTMAMIGLNCLVFVLMVSGTISGSAKAAMWVLQYGDAFDPLQLVTSMFSHADIGHLLGNMIFLWVFGQLVEGRMRSWSFVLFYIGTGVLTGIFEMLLMSGSDSGSLGASSAISALMVAAIIWTPLNRVNCLFIWFPYIRRFDFPVYGIALYYVGWDLVSTLFLGFNHNSTPLLHTLGAVAGFIPALVILKIKWVDCEGWDVLSIWKHGHPQHRLRSARLEREEKGWRPPQEQKVAQALGMFRQAMLERNAILAVEILQQQLAGGIVLPLDRQELSWLTQALIKQHQYRDAASVLVHFHQRFPDYAPALLQLAWLKIVHLQQPGEGLQLLSSLQHDMISERLKRQVHALQVRAQKVLHQTPA